MWAATSKDFPFSAPLHASIPPSSQPLHALALTPSQPLPISLASPSSRAPHQEWNQGVGNKGIKSEHGK